jgi:phage tail sheath protein FI
VDTEAIKVNILINGGYCSSTVQLAMDAVAAARGDAVAVLDVPSASQSVQSALDYRNITLNLNSSRSALYTPDVLIQDTYNNMPIYVPPSGYVAACFARTDYVAQPWYAPAGLNRGLLRVQGVRYKYNKDQRDMLAPAQVNYIRNFPGKGIAVWEQRTLQTKQSALSWVSVRRLFDVIEVSVSDFLLYSVHEPNDDWLRIQIVGAIGEFLEAVRLARGLKKYLVKCDTENNPAWITGQGQLNVDLYAEPVLPAEKIQLKTIITRQGVDFQELIASGVSNF